MREKETDVDKFSITIKMHRMTWVIPLSYSPCKSETTP